MGSAVLSPAAPGRARPGAPRVSVGPVSADVVTPPLLVPPALLVPFSVEQARVAGVGVKALQRLVHCGLVDRTPLGVHTLVEPIRPERLALAAVGPPAALCGPTAAELYGWPQLHHPAAVHLLVPEWRHPFCWPDAVTHRWAVRRADLHLLDGVPVTTPLRTALDLAAVGTLAEALVVLDAVLRNGILRRQDLESAMATTGRARPRRERRQRTAVGKADPRRASPPEAVFAALVDEARLPRPEAQFTVRVDGVFIGRVDFAWPGRRLIVEIDGYAYHGGRDNWLRDQRRQAKLTNAGWRVLRFAAVDVLNRPGEVVAAVRDGLALPLPRQQARNS